jgi:hypothetical protein
LPLLQRTLLWELDFISTMAQLGGLAVESDSVIDRAPEKEPDTPAAPSTAPGALRPQYRRPHDANVTFEEYYYYAQQTRAEEESQPLQGRESNFLSLVLPSKSDGGIKQKHSGNSDLKPNPSKSEPHSVISDEEWTNASRALRTATKGAVFYLITTDILGPFGLPYAFATMGWG